MRLGRLPDLAEVIVEHAKPRHDEAIGVALLPRELRAKGSGSLARLVSATGSRSYFFAHHVLNIFERSLIRREESQPVRLRR
jgi:hypothetical protein